MGWDGPVTHRQFITWREWDRSQMEQPDRSDFYAMQIAAEVRRLRYLTARSKKGVDTNELKITFKPTTSSQEKIPGRTVEEKTKAATAMAQATWFARLGMNPKVINADSRT